MYRDEYPIRVSQQEAIARVRALTDYWDATYRTRTEWNGNRGVISGRVLGLSFWARFTVEVDRLRGELKVSSLAVRMGGRGYLKRKLDDYLDPDHALEDLRARVPDLAAAVQA